MHTKHEGLFQAAPLTPQQEIFSKCEEQTKLEGSIAHCKESYQEKCGALKEKINQQLDNVEKERENALGSLSGNGPARLQARQVLEGTRDYKRAALLDPKKNGLQALETEHAQNLQPLEAALLAVDQRISELVQQIKAIQPTAASRNM